MTGCLTIHRTDRRVTPGSSNPPPEEHTTYIREDRRREERRSWAGYRCPVRRRTIYQAAPRIASITRCDLKRSFSLNLEDRQYTSSPIDTSLQEWMDRAKREGRGKALPGQRREPNVLVETETVDTGERKEVFGHMARHVITTRRVIPLPRTDRPTQQTTVTGGWYIDLDTHISCDWRASLRGHSFCSITSQGEERPVPTFKDIGEPVRGFAVLIKSTHSSVMRGPDGVERPLVSIFESEVTELSMADLDLSLFEVPPDFSLVERIRQQSGPPLTIRAWRAYKQFDWRVRCLAWQCQRTLWQLGRRLLR